MGILVVWVGMSKPAVNPPSGFRDFAPAEAALRRELLQTIASVYGLHGFQEVSLSALENLSTLQGKGGGTDNEKLVFKVMKRGEELERAKASQADLADLGLRFDLTLPLARFCARFTQIPRPFKVFQMGPVWRADRPQKGRFREFFQCDVDIVGAQEWGAELEVLLAILAVFEKVGLEGLELHLNDRNLLHSFRPTGASDEQWSKALVALDKLDKLEASQVIDEVTLILGGLSDNWRKIVEGFSLTDAPDSVKETAQDLGLLIGNLQKLAPGVRVQFNPSLVRGQDYYTGTIFELRHKDLSGSLGGGGRYNRLLEVFGAAETPAFGGSIGFERLALLLEAKALGSKAPKVFLPLLGDQLREPCAALAQRLRKSGIAVDLYPDAAKLTKQFKYADSMGFPLALILGESEIQSGTVKIKNLSSREETVSDSGLGLEQKIRTLLLVE
jgi:histidyl-tRNA synthetase